MAKFEGFYSQVLKVKYQDKLTRATSQEQPIGPCHS